MKHPQREDWIPYLFGEASSPDRKRLSQHLNECPECAREIAGWRRSLRQLNRWPLPKPVAFAGPGRFQTLKWGLAAAVVLGIGVVTGRLSSGQETRLTEFRNQLEASVRSTLRSDMNEALDQFQKETSNAVRGAELRLANASSLENQKVWRSLLEVLDTARTEDGRAVQAMLQQVQDQHDARFVQLRKDLETLASTTDDEIRQARVNLMQLASSTTSLNP